MDESTVKTEGKQAESKEEAESLNKKNFSDSLALFDEEIKSLKRKASNINFNLNLINWMIAVILVAVVVAFIFISLDYFKYNEERYEKFIDKSSEIAKECYPKEAAEKKEIVSDKNDKIIMCLSNKKYWQYEQCFK